MWQLGLCHHYCCCWKKWIWRYFICLLKSVPSLSSNSWRNASCTSSHQSSNIPQVFLCSFWRRFQRSYPYFAEHSLVSSMVHCFLSPRRQSCIKFSHLLGFSLLFYGNWDGPISISSLFSEVFFFTLFILYLYNYPYS